MQVKQTNPAKWKKFRKILNEIKTHAPQGYKAEARVLAQAIKLQVQEVMIAQASQWATPPRAGTQGEMARNYTRFGKARKKRVMPKRNAAAPIDILLLDTMQYYQSIRVTMGKSNKTATMVDGIYHKGTTTYTVAPNERFKVAGNSSLSMRDLAYLLETGSSKMPARGMWKYIEEKIARGTQRVLGQMKRRMKKKYDHVERHAVWPQKFKNKKYKYYTFGF